MLCVFLNLRGVVDPGEGGVRYGHVQELTKQMMRPRGSQLILGILHVQEF